MNRNLFFNELGYNLEDCDTLEKALSKSKLNYIVKQENIYLKNGKIIPNKFANVIEEDGSFLGIVGKDYHIVQNNDGFALLKLIEKDYKYIRGFNFNQKRSSMLIMSKLTSNLFTGEFGAFLGLTNSFDGVGGIGFIQFITFRGIPLYLTSIKSPAIKHSSQVTDFLENTESFENKLDDIYQQYYNAINGLNFKVDEKYINKLLEKISGKNSAGTKILIERANNQIKDILSRFNKLKEDNTAFYLLVAIADYEMNREPIRDTGNLEVYLKRFLDGMILTNEAYKYMKRGK